VNIYIRTNFSSNTGLGHLMRCNRLSLELKKRGHNCLFFLDKPHSLINIDFKRFYIYGNNKKYLNENEDAKFFCQITNSMGKGIILLDDYRFSKIWEKHVSKFHKKIIIFDDLETKDHYADFIINYNPKNYPIIKYNFNRNKKKGCKFLINPQFNIVGKKNLLEKQKKDLFFKITFYIGGGSDQIIVHNLLIKLLKKIKNKKIKFIVIVGPLAKNKLKIINLAKKYKSVECVCGLSDITCYIKQSQLFIGSAGTAIFETALFKVPSILVKMTQNQSTDIFSLERIGHYIYLDLSDFLNSKKMSELIFLLEKKYSRFKVLNKKPEIKIDNSGAKRILDYIFLNKKNILKKKKIKIEKIKKDNLSIRSVTDKDLNHYLYSRNLEINTNNSTSKNKINKLDHYLWWFKNKRKSYVLTRNGLKILYLYEENLFSLKNIQYNISGWFACSKDCTIKEILYALNWQRYKYKKNVKWLSFIKNSNKLSIKLSKYLGWSIVKDKDESIDKFKSLLNIKTNGFIFYKR
jgi:spore coat polysaccharide biosynthesis predicted glycosyltransferase SpsG